ncbi:MAG: hypothetical protein O2829_10910 [Bacteroidetes bacterium]|nr:hypothetical protein [Bacteroidota bacterium]MDA1269573.1 hypothetical protein [Bacteroidota bacterium]
MVMLFCLVLGLAPFFPEPHNWGKIRWVAGCAGGMGTMDCLDLLWHGIPWLFLICLDVMEVQKIRKIVQFKGLV